MHIECTPIRILVNGHILIMSHINTPNFKMINSWQGWTFKNPLETMIDMNVITPWIWYGWRFVLDKGYQLQITETMGTIKSGRCNLSYTNSHMMRVLSSKSLLKFVQVMESIRGKLQLPTLQKMDIIRWTWRTWRPHLKHICNGMCRKIEILVLKAIWVLI